MDKALEDTGLYGHQTGIAKHATMQELIGPQIVKVVVVNQPNAGKKLEQVNNFLSNEFLSLYF